MRIWGVTAIGLLFLAPPLLAAESSLTVEEAVQLALTRNERAKIADLDLVEAEAAVEKARAGFLPVLAATGTQTNRQHATPYNLTNEAVTLSQPVVDASAWPLYGASRHDLSAQVASSTDAKRVLAFDAAVSFLSTLTAQGELDAARKRVDTAQSDLSDTQARVDAQLNSSNDVSRAQVNLADSQQAAANNQAALEEAYLALTFVLNAKVTGPLTAPAGMLTRAAGSIDDADRLVALALKTRPDVVASRETVRADRLLALEPLLRMVPTVSVTGAYTRTSNPPPGGQPDEQSVLGTATWILYDAGVRYADRKSRLAAAEVAQLELTTLERSVDQQVRAALASLKAEQEAFQAAGRGVEASRRSVDETRTLYQHGLAKAIELTDANDARFVEEVGYTDAQYSMARAYLALRQAMGLDALGKDLP